MYSRLNEYLGLASAMPLMRFVNDSDGGSDDEALGSQPKSMTLPVGLDAVVPQADYHQTSTDSTGGAHSTTVQLSLSADLLKERLNRDIRDVHQALMEQTPDWKLVEPCMSTSPSNTEDRQGANVQGSLLEPEERETHKRTVYLKQDATSQSNHSSSLPPYSATAHSSYHDINNGILKESGSKCKDEWEFHGSSDSEYGPTLGRRDVSTRKVRSGNAEKQAVACKTNTGLRGKSNSKKRSIPEEVDEERDVWEPMHKLRTVHEPSTVRKTRRQGSVDLVEGLPRRKRRRRTTDLQTCSAAEDSQCSVVASTRAFTEDGGPVVDPAIVIDLTNPHLLLSESQKQKYEEMSAPQSSAGTHPQPVFEDESTILKPLSACPDQSSTAVNTQLSPFLDSESVDALSRPVTSQGQATSTFVSKHEQPRPSCTSSDASLQNSKPEQANELPSEPSTINMTRIPRQSTDFDISDTQRQETAPTFMHGASKRDASRPRETKAKKPKSKARSKPELSEFDELLGYEPGVPREMYKPRPSRFRSGRTSEVASEMASETASINESKQLDTPESQSSALSHPVEGKAKGGKRGRKKTKKRDRSAEVEIHKEQQEVELKESETSTSLPPRKRGRTRGPDEASTAAITSVPYNSDLKLDTDTKGQPTKPFQELTNESQPRAPEALPTACAPSTPPKAPSTEVKTKASMPAHENPKMTTPPILTPHTSPKKQSSPHSPLQSGKVPYRVGLSKRVRIQPLLRIVKK